MNLFLLPGKQETENGYDTVPVCAVLGSPFSIIRSRDTDLIMQEIVLAAFSVISSLLIVFGLVLLGWYLVWKFFLSRFRFVRELMGGISESSSVNDLKNGRSRIKKIRRD